ncbi:hypothetical protein Bca52824_029095 [Brassica carinata]|uniref:Uncharacterized protein n=1 Tax=Brassica carinata TaxID=52824 RepID=A0A8X7VDD1_BRACI|nr:hypothetical protein Bca52824_029095 [Brassica carinata]
MGEKNKAMLGKFSRLLPPGHSLDFPIQQLKKNSRPYRLSKTLRPYSPGGVFNALAEPQIRIDQGWEIFRNTFFRGRTNLHGSIYYERGKDIGAIDWEENEEDYDDAEEKYTSPAQSSQRPPLSENFEKDRHLVYLEMMYELLLYHYQSQVINFLTLAHFIISGLHFLGARDRGLPE